MTLTRGRALASFAPAPNGSLVRSDSFEAITIGSVKLTREGFMCATTAVVRPSLHSPEVMQFETALRSKIIGQEEGLQALVDLYQVLCAGLNSPGRKRGACLS